MKSSFSSDQHHEVFEELAALAAVGELSPLEQERLGRHLEECPQCRETCETFAIMASNDLGIAATSRESTEALALDDASDAEARQHLGRLRKRLNPAGSRLISESTKSPTLGEPAGPRNSDSSEAWSRRLAVLGVAAGVVLAAMVGRGVTVRQMSKTVSVERERSGELQSLVDSMKREKNDDKPGTDSAVLRSLDESQKSRDALQKSLAASQAKNDELLARQKASEDKLAGAIANVEQLRQQLAATDTEKEKLASLQRESDTKLREALVELYQARQASPETAANSEARVDHGPETASQPTAEAGPNASSPSEVEARNLFGARDLHIVDVYDVKGDGKTKRTYGRVYYVEKKLLVFYAFDLQDRQDHKRGVFQAWGYRESSGAKPVSLGLFTIDDNAMSRWVLTVNHPDVLSHIDAVFVTVEPLGGSTSPQGKKVLYANLIGPPNHP
jgi:Putative zinc-finger